MTRIEPVRETLHGVEVVDNYRWLEGDNSNPERMGQVTPEVAAWTDLQNAYTRSVLDNLPGRKALEEKLRPLMEVGSVSTPAIRGDRYFFSRREGARTSRSTTGGRAPSGTRSSCSTRPARSVGPDDDHLDLAVAGRQQVAYGTYKAGDENTTLHLLEVDSGKLLPLEIPNKTQAPDWLPDGSGFLYQNLADEEPVQRPGALSSRGHHVAQDLVSSASTPRRRTRSSRRPGVQAARCRGTASG